LNFLIYLYQFFCSLKLAIFTLSSLIVLLAIGTFYESFYGRQAAGEVIYRSYWMNALLFLLAINIIAVMIDRWPWKKKHTGFLLAHFGIIFVLVGSLMTRFYGVDAHIRLSLGEMKNQIVTSATFLMVYSSFDGKNLTELYRERVQFFRHSPSEKNPHIVPLGSDRLRISDFYTSAIAREHYEVAIRGGPALRFRVKGRQANVVRWMFRPPWMDKVKLSLGKAQLFLLKDFSVIKEEEIDRPSLLLVSMGESLHYELRRPKSNEVLKGVLKLGSILDTGWMDMQFHVIEYLPKALPNTVFIEQERVVDRSVSAIQVDFKGEKRWIGLNSHLFFYEEDKVYIVAYVNEKVNPGFKLKLKDFKITRYPSSFKAASYESEVAVNDETETKRISMNNPLKLEGYTIYQSGFEENDQGDPIASVLSVNKDPGRFIKYFGSLLIVLGSIVLFMRRNRRLR